MHSAILNMFLKLDSVVENKEQHVDHLLYQMHFKPLSESIFGNKMYMFTKHLFEYCNSPRWFVINIFLLII